MDWPLLEGTYKITDVEEGELRVGKICRVKFDGPPHETVPLSAEFMITGRKNGVFTGFLISTPVTIDTTRSEPGSITFRKVKD